MADISTFDSACINALKSFSFNEFKDIQRKALKEIVLGNDVFVNLPTGSGKSLIFQTAPLVFDHMEECSGSIVLVISPLVSLMKDQVNFLTSKGVKAAFIGQEQDDEAVKAGVEQGKYQVVYGSPETFLANKRWRSMLTNEVYRDKLRLLCVDEAHCIAHWGFSAKKGEKAFRIWFSRINELRSVMNKVPVAALTATASKKTRDKICTSLEMESAVVFTETPNRANIGYSVKLASCDVNKTFCGLIDELRSKKKDCERVIIYCPRISIVSNLYGIFKAGLGDAIYAHGDTQNLRERTVEMFHARIDDENKDEILKSFAKEDGVIRVLIATIAYGMGIDCKNVKTVIHYGSPRNLECYLQESGRAGRSGERGCKSVILYSNVMLQHCDDDIVGYIRNDTQCRRKALLAHFDCELVNCSYENPHECCDICQEKCKCTQGQCVYRYFNTTIPTSFSQDIQVSKRTVTTTDVKQLTSKLEYLQKSLNNSFKEQAASATSPLFTPVSLVSGFGECQIIQVIDNASRIMSMQDVYKFVDIWHKDVAIEILFVINTVFGDIMFDFDDDAEEEDTQPVQDIEFWDFEDDDSAILAALAGFTISEDLLGGFDD